MLEIGQGAIAILIAKVSGRAGEGRGLAERDRGRAYAVFRWGGGAASTDAMKQAPSIIAAARPLSLLPIVFIPCR